MIPGYNHNVKYKNDVFHVQTEDNGLDNPSIVTHLFIGGNIIATRRSSYRDIASNENAEDVIKNLMQEQHKQMVRDLINGKFDDDMAAMQKPAIEPPPSDVSTLDLDSKSNEEKSLDEIILDYLSKESD